MTQLDLQLAVGSVAESGPQLELQSVAELVAGSVTQLDLQSVAESGTQLDLQSVVESVAGSDHCSAAPWDELLV